jgi:SAM-dependent methyltransferase
MMQSIAKFQHSVRSIGVLPTLARSARYLRFLLEGRARRRRTLELIAAPGIEERFTKIYESNYWGHAESVSGEGSSLAYTRELRAALPGLFDRFGVQRLLDAPCGDFNWMQHVLREHPLEYVGGDLVAPMVAKLQQKYAQAQHRFMHLDITRGPFPAADLWLCRDCLFHLSNADIGRALRVFLASEIAYLLTTTHLNPDGYFINTDIRSGDFRRIDLYAAPFHFPRDVLLAIDDWCAPEPPRQMGLWSRAQVAAALACGGLADEVVVAKAA